MMKTTFRAPVILFLCGMPMAVAQTSAVQEREQIVLMAFGILCGWAVTHKYPHLFVKILTGLVAVVGVAAAVAAVTLHVPADNAVRILTCAVVDFSCGALYVCGITWLLMLSSETGLPWLAMCTSVVSYLFGFQLGASVLVPALSVKHPVFGAAIALAVILVPGLLSSASEDVALCKADAEDLPL